ncbi:sigma-70 family RNA polymerase sigma factor [Rhodohalobacter sp. 614A]|uniref:sigma-70 family RNA polymerase sigma factor n=1 Tax=Rhodohalobacter sp. 614A TaxID=2908649 RepID=UPI001F1F2CC9|nr:sigma-70 family RNA polymerase sigma factor [Rhodohalobacter sp. 614A]
MRTNQSNHDIHYSVFYLLCEKGHITQLLVEARNGKKSALDSLYPYVYKQLKQLARHHLASERHGHTLQKTALVHELYMKLIDQSEVEWQNRAHFYSIASRCMQQILVDYARKKKADKRGGKHEGITLDEDRLNVDQHAEEIIELNDLIEKLTQLDSRKSQVVIMRFFGGMTIPEISEVLDVTTRTVDRDWAKAKMWLYNELKAS